LKTVSIGTFTQDLGLILVIGGLIDALAGDGGSNAWVSVFVFGIALIIEKAQTIYHAKHYVNEYIPLAENFAPATATS
jgi:hypothetical protein